MEGESDWLDITGGLCFLRDAKGEKEERKGVRRVGVERIGIVQMKTRHGATLIDSEPPEPFQSHFTVMGIEAAHFSPCHTEIFIISPQ